MPSPTRIEAFADILTKFQILVPEAFLGKSIAKIADSNTPAPVANTATKPYKCFKIDTERDIKNGQILIDPTTGESLTNTLAQDAIDASGGDSSLLIGDEEDGSSGIMPGDIQSILEVICIIIGAIVALAYLMYILHRYFYLKQSVTTHVVVFVLFLTGLSALGAYLSGDIPEE
jgi:hypothetical protein